MLAHDFANVLDQKRQRTVPLSGPNFNHCAWRKKRSVPRACKSSLPGTRIGRQSDQRNGLIFGLKLNGCHPSWLLCLCTFVSLRPFRVLTWIEVRAGTKSNQKLTPASHFPSVTGCVGRSESVWRCTRWILRGFRIRRQKFCQGMALLERTVLSAWLDRVFSVLR